ncbi:MAG: hypothetical protein JXA67_01425 [Micromonosporaceae bacterium]|nr:hypothetical protein [Micromonosporaceae bacterium]
MEQERASTVVPLRPLTLGEVLDAAVGLLRENALALLPAALICSAVEQAILYPLRVLADVRPPTYFPPVTDRLGEYWLMITVGLAAESAAIALLGGISARAAAAAIRGVRRPPRALLTPRGSRLPAIALVTAMVAGAVWLSCLACWLPWVLAYGLLGLAIPAVVIDGKGVFGALGRSLVLSVRGGLRAARIRLTGYLGWLAIRSGLGFGAIAALDYVIPTTTAWVTVTGIAVWLAANTVAYATLACLDSVVHCETRMRTEGLDIMAVRARRANRPIDLAVPR